jgi:hypothetical protein
MLMQLSAVPSSLPFRVRGFLLASQAINTVFFGGDPDESLSARAWRQRNAGWDRACTLIDRFLGLGHCQRVWQAQKVRERSRLP